MTSLTVLNPLALSLLPLAALPVLFHFFFRLRKKPRVFSTLMFFHRIDPKLNARRRLREWLVLLLRALLIACVLLALAHPLWVGVGREGSVAVALVIDNSGSMSGAGADGRTKLKEAVEAARGLVAQLREKDSAGLVLLVDDPLVPLPAGLTSDKAALRNALDQLGETEASGSVAAALERALALLENSPATHFEVHVLSDLQQKKWSQPPVNLRPPRATTSLVVHRLPTRSRPKSNVALAGVQVPMRVILSGRKVPVEVQLANTLAAESHVRLDWQTDSGERGSEEITVPAGADQTAQVLLPAQSAGLRWASFQIANDDFDADNRAYLAFNCQEKKRVVFVGEAAAFGQLPLAVSPTGDGRLSGLVPSYAAAPDYSGDFVVLTWDGLGAEAGTGWGALKNFLAAGGGALIVPAAGTTAAPGSVPDWLAAAPGGLETASNGPALVVLDKANAVFSDLRDAKGEILLRTAKVSRFLPLRASPRATPLLGLEDGRALLAEQIVGRGRLFTSGVAFDSAWTTLPLKPGFLALAQNLALTASGLETNISPIVAGERLRLPLPPDATLEVQSLGGSPLDWKGRTAQITTLPRSGVYVARGTGGASYVAVRASDKEGYQEFVANDNLPALGSLSYSVKAFGGGEALVSEFRRLEKSLDLSSWFLLLAFLALAAEGWLAHTPPLKPSPAARPKPAFVETHAA